MAAARTTLYHFTPVPQTRAMVIAIATQTVQTLSAAVVAVLSALVTFTSKTTARANLPEQLLSKEQMAPPARGKIPLRVLKFSIITHCLFMRHNNSAIQLLIML